MTRLSAERPERRRTMRQKADKRGKVRLVALMLPAELEAVQEYARAQGRSASALAGWDRARIAGGWRVGRGRGRGEVERLKG